MEENELEKQKNQTENENLTSIVQENNSETKIEEKNLKTNLNDADITNIIDEKTIDEQIKKSKEALKKDKTPQKKLWSFIFLVLNVVIVALILLGMVENDNYVPFTDITLNYNWVVIAILAFCAMVFCDQFRYYKMIKKTTKTRRPILAYKVASLGKYYDCITPFATGGQPFQAYYLSTRGIKASHAVSIPIAKYIVQQMIFAIMALVLLILAFTKYKYSLPFDSEYSKLVCVACWIGYAFNSLIVLLVVILSIGTFGKKLVLGVLKLLHKIKLVKNYDELYNKILKIVEEYQKTILFFIKSPILLIEMIVPSILYYAIQYSLPFIVFCCFGGTFAVDTWFVFCLVALIIDLAASFIPLPGGSGVAELCFTAMFTGLLGVKIFWALLFWRCLSYYAFVLQGFFMVLYDTFIGNKRNKKKLRILKKRYPLYYGTDKNKN